MFAFRLSGAKLELEVRGIHPGSEAAIRITFSHYLAFFATDEGDLTRYWGSDQFKDGLVYEILEGGLLWQESQLPGLLAVTAAQPGVREWFISTSGECITVISTTEPLVCLAKNLEP